MPPGQGTHTPSLMLLVQVEQKEKSWGRGDDADSQQGFPLDHGRGLAARLLVFFLLSLNSFMKPAGLRGGLARLSRGAC